MTNDAGDAGPFDRRRQFWFVRETLSTAATMKPIRNSTFGYSSVLLVALCCCYRTALASPTPAIKLSSLEAHDRSSFVREIVRRSKAAEIRNNLNESCDPCENFYAFACGNWHRVNGAEVVGEIATDIFVTLANAMAEKFGDIVEEGAQPNDTDADSKLKSFYQSCMRIGELGDAYLPKLMAIMAEFGQMPLLMPDGGAHWADDQFDWLETVGRIYNTYGFNIILGFEIQRDFANTSVNRVYLSQPDFWLEHRSVYVDEDMRMYREAYTRAIASDLVRFLKVSDKDVAQRAAEEMMELEVALATNTPDTRDGRGIDELAVLTTVAELQQRYAPALDIVRLVNISFGVVLEEPVYEYHKYYQERLAAIIDNTPKRIVANYIFYLLLENFFVKTEATADEQREKCITATKKFFAANLDNLVYRRFNNEENERDYALIWQEIRETFKWVLLGDTLAWIDAQTRQSAAKKLETIQLEINSYEGRNFSEELQGVTFDDNDFVDNLRQVRILNSRRMRADLHQPPKSVESGETLSYTPVYLVLENMIKIPVAMLQPYYLSAPGYPNALKFANIGFLIGHELVHGFDDNGRKYDAAGNVHNWWDAESTAAFVERTKCFANQYSQYVYGGMPLPCSVGQMENIADNGGLRLAYAAYLRWYEEAARSGSQDLRLETLPHLNYTSEQLFFIAFGQFFCSDVLPSVQHFQVATEAHTPAKYRVIGALSNYAEFAKVFNCSADSAMNPTEKCIIY